MADRFPSLEDFDAGGRCSRTTLYWNTADSVHEAQTDIKDASADPSTDDFLAREKAILGDDADQFATNDDAAAFGDSGDLLGGGDNVDSTFESQFPDIATPTPVSITEFRVSATFGLTDMCL